MHTRLKKAPTATAPLALHTATPDKCAQDRRPHTGILEHLKYRYIGHEPLIAGRRSVEELSFAFSVLLALPLDRMEAARRFSTLWDEVNAAALTCADTDTTLTYIALLQKMDRHWRQHRSMNQS
jgi:hypothetical protein